MTDARCRSVLSPASADRSQPSERCDSCVADIENACAPATHPPQIAPIADYALRYALLPVYMWGAVPTQIGETLWISPSCHR